MQQEYGIYWTARVVNPDTGEVETCNMVGDGEFYGLSPQQIFDRAQQILAPLGELVDVHIDGFFR